MHRLVLNLFTLIPTCVGTVRKENMDFKRQLLGAAERLGLARPEGNKIELPQKPQPQEDVRESIVKIETATLCDGTIVKVGDTLEIRLSTGEVVARPVIQEILSPTEVIANGNLIENIKAKNIRKVNE